jgi:beta-glucosidase-like glycosyl hydrolase
MVSNAFYGGAPYRASLEAATYRLLRSAPVERWAPQAIRAGADVVLFTTPAHARRAVRALLPLARRGELDEHVRRLLRFRG